MSSNQVRASASLPAPCQNESVKNTRSKKIYWLWLWPSRCSFERLGSQQGQLVLASTSKLSSPVTCGRIHRPARHRSRASQATALRPPPPACQCVRRTFGLKSTEIPTSIMSVA